MWRNYTAKAMKSNHVTDLTWELYGIQRWPLGEGGGKGGDGADPFIRGCRPHPGEGQWGCAASWWLAVTHAAVAESLELAGKFLVANIGLSI